MLFVAVLAIYPPRNIVRNGTSCGCNAGNRYLNRSVFIQYGIYPLEYGILESVVEGRRVRRVREIKFGGHAPRAVNCKHREFDECNVEDGSAIS